MTGFFGRFDLEIALQVFLELLNHLLTTLRVVKRLVKTTLRVVLLYSLLKVMQIKMPYVIWRKTLLLTVFEIGVTPFSLIFTLYLGSHVGQTFSSSNEVGSVHFSSRRVFLLFFGERRTVF